MFPFSLKSLRTILIIKELIKDKNKFNRKAFPVFHDKENSEDRFSEFSYYMKGFRIPWTLSSVVYTMKLSRNTYFMKYSKRNISQCFLPLRTLFCIKSQRWLLFEYIFIWTVFCYFFDDFERVFVCWQRYRINIVVLWIFEIPYPANKYSKSTKGALKQDVKSVKR